MALTANTKCEMLEHSGLHDFSLMYCLRPFQARLSGCCQIWCRHVSLVIYFIPLWYVEGE